MTPESLVNAAVRHQVFLERLKSGQIQATQKTLEDVQTTLISILQKLEVSSMDQLSRAKFQALATEFQKVEQELLRSHAGELVSELKELTEYEIELEHGLLSRATKGTTFTLPSATKAFNAVRNAPLSATGDLLGPFIDGMTANAVKQTNRVLQRGFNEGWTVQEMVRSVRGTKSRNFRDGVTALKRRQTEAVVRTATQHVASRARFEVWAANADLVRGYKWLSTLDNRTTPTCRSLDGKSFKLGKGPTPPIHVNCRSTTVADLDDGLEFLSKGATRSGLFGPVSADMSYYDWLKKQHRGFVESAIGKQRAQLFLDGGLSIERFRDLQLDKQFQPLTLADMRKLEPAAFKNAGL